MLLAAAAMIEGGYWQGLLRGMESQLMKNADTKTFWCQRYLRKSIGSKDTKMFWMRTLKIRKPFCMHPKIQDTKTNGGKMQFEFNSFFIRNLHHSAL
jgi:hypothetical protein